MVYVQANILRLPCTSIHTQRARVLQVMVPRGLVAEILAVKGSNFLLTTSYYTPRDELMERARSYQASLEAMYINNRPHVGSLIHTDHRSNLQTLLSQYNEDILDMKGTIGAVQIRELKFRKSVEPPPVDRHRRLRHRHRPTTATTTPMPTLMPKTSRRCRWQSPDPPPRCAGGARGWRAANLATAGPAPAASPNLKPAGRGKGKSLRT
jgi:hypothetical protein